MLNRRFSLTRKLHPKALHLIFIAALLAVALGTAPVKPVQADPAPLAGAVSPGGLLNPDGTLDTTTGFQGALDLRGWEVTLDGERGPLFKPVSRPAAPLIAWQALPNKGLGVQYSYEFVSALAVSGDDLYVGGDFAQTGDGSLTALGNIARYDTTAGTWYALPNKGLTYESGYGSVRALTVSGDDLYVGGGFTQTGDGSLTGLGSIARYDTTAGTWHALPNQGLDVSIYGGVSALVVSGGDLYVGGVFEQTGDGTLTELGSIARYDTKAGAWHRLPNLGLNRFGSIRALVLSGDDLYVGGEFNRTGDGALTDLGNIARYDTTAGVWHALPNKGLLRSDIMGDSVETLIVSGDDLYVGGNFDKTGDGSLKDLGRIARYDTTAGAWHALPNKGLNYDVYALAVSGGDLYVGGWFSRTGDGSLTDLGRIARYDTTTGAWYALPNQGMDRGVGALAVPGDDLYVGGQFDQTGDGSLTDLGHIARCTLVVTQVVNVYLPLVFAK